MKDGGALAGGGRRGGWWLALLVSVAADAGLLAPALFTAEVRAPGSATSSADASDDRVDVRPELVRMASRVRPGREVVAASWSRARFPLWDPHSAGGMPLAGHSDAGPVSPFAPLLLLLGEDGDDLRQLLQMLVAQVFCLLLLRRAGGGPLAGLVAGLAWSLSAFLQDDPLGVRAGTLAFAPMVVWSLARLRAVSGLRPAAPVGLALGLALLAGDFTAALAAAGVGFAIFVLVRDGGPVLPAFWRALVGAGLGLGLGALAWGPALAFALETGDPSAVVGADDAVWWGAPWSWSLARPPLALTVFGLAAFGLVLSRAAAGRLARGLGLAALLGFVVVVVARAAPDGPATLPVRTTSVLVALPLVLLAGLGAERLRDRARGRGRVWLGVVLVLVVGGEGLARWRDHLPARPAEVAAPTSPTLELLGRKARGGRVLGLGGALAPELPALSGLDDAGGGLASGCARRRRLVAALGGFYRVGGRELVFGSDPRAMDLLGVGALLSTFKVDYAPRIASRLRVGPGEPWRETLALGPRGVVEVTVVAADGGPVADLAFVLRGPRGLELAFDSVAPPTLPLVRLGLGTLTAPDDRPGAELLRLEHGGRAGRRLAFRLDSRDGGRVAIELATRGGAVLVDRIERGAVGEVRFEGRGAGQTFVWSRPDALPRAYVASTVETVASIGQALERLAAPDFDPHRVTVVETDLARPWWRGGAGAVAPLAVDVFAPEELAVVVDAERDGVVVFTDSFAPGWRARVDGRAVSVLPANVVGRAVPVARGHHRVVLVYRPTEVLVALVATALAALGILAGLLGIRFGRRRSPA